MDTNQIIKVKEIVDSDCFLRSADGEKVYCEIRDAFDDVPQIVVDMAGIRAWAAEAFYIIYKKLLSEFTKEILIKKILWINENEYKHKDDPVFKRLEIDMSLNEIAETYIDDILQYIEMKRMFDERDQKILEKRKEWPLDWLNEEQLEDLEYCIWHSPEKWGTRHFDWLHSAIEMAREAKKFVKIAETDERYSREEHGVSLWPNRTLRDLRLKFGLNLDKNIELGENED